MATKEEIAARLRLARLRRGFAKAADAARAMKIDYPTYAAHENATRGLRVDVASRYADFFGVPLNWLLEGKGELGLAATLIRKIERLPASVQQEAIDYVDFLASKRAG